MRSRRTATRALRRGEGERGETRFGRPRVRARVKEKNTIPRPWTWPRAADGDGASESFGGERGRVRAGGCLPEATANTPHTATAPRINRPGLGVLNPSRPAREPSIASSEAVTRNNGECSSVRPRASAVFIVCDHAHEARYPVSPAERAARPRVRDRADRPGCGESRLRLRVDGKRSFLLANDRRRIDGLILLESHDTRRLARGLCIEREVVHSLLAGLDLARLGVNH